MRIAPHSNDASIVLIGRFSPPMFHPAWFSAHSLIGKKEADAAEIEIMQQQLSIFRTENFRVQAFENRIVIEGRREPHVQIFDLTVKMLADLLHAIPIWKMGMNFSANFPARDFRSYTKLGDMLAPKDVWGSWGKRLAWDGESEDRRSGLVSITVEQNKSLEEFGHLGHIRTKLEQSKRVQLGISMDINDEIRLAEESTTDAREMTSLLQANWEGSRKRAHEIIDDIMERVA